MSDSLAAFNVLEVNVMAGLPGPPGSGGRDGLPGANGDPDSPYLAVSSLRARSSKERASDRISLLDDAQNNGSTQTAGVTAWAARLDDNYSSSLNPPAGIRAGYIPGGTYDSAVTTVHAPGAFWTVKGDGRPSVLSGVQIDLDHIWNQVHDLTFIGTTQGGSFTAPIALNFTNRRALAFNVHVAGLPVAFAQTRPGPMGGLPAKNTLAFCQTYECGTGLRIGEDGFSTAEINVIGCDFMQGDAALGTGVGIDFRNGGQVRLTHVHSGVSPLHGMNIIGKAGGSNPNESYYTAVCVSGSGVLDEAGMFPRTWPITAIATHSAGARILVTLNTAVATTTGNITSTSPIITNIPSTAGWQVGQRVAGAGILAGTYIDTIDSATQVTMTQRASATTVGVSIIVDNPLTIALGDDVDMSGTGVAGYDTPRTYVYDVILPNQLVLNMDFVSTATGILSVGNYDMNWIAGDAIQNVRGQYFTGCYAESFNISGGYGWHWVGGRMKRDIHLPTKVASLFIVRNLDGEYGGLATAKTTPSSERVKDIYPHGDGALENVMLMGPFRRNPASGWSPNAGDLACGMSMAYTGAGMGLDGYPTDYNFIYTSNTVARIRVQSNEWIFSSTDQVGAGGLLAPPSSTGAAQSFTGDTTSGDAVISNLSIDSSLITIGQTVTGTGIGNESFVRRRITPTSISLTKVAQATNTGVSFSSFSDGSHLTIQAGAPASGAATSGHMTIRGGNSPSAVIPAGQVRIIGGAATGTMDGAIALFQGGDSGTGATGNGGEARGFGGDAISTNGNGGKYILRGGLGNGTGKTGIASVSSIFTQRQIAAAVISTTSTISALSFVRGLVSSTPASGITLTLPLGADVEAELPAILQNDSIRFTLMNLATDFSVILATNTGWTLEGNMTIQPESSGMFLFTRGASSGTFTLSRTSAGIAGTRYIDANSGTRIRAINPNAGAAASAIVEALNGTGTAAMRMMALGTGFTTAGYQAQDAGVLVADAGLSGGLSIASLGGSTRFYTGATPTLAATINDTNQRFVFVAPANLQQGIAITGKTFATADAITPLTTGRIEVITDSNTAVIGATIAGGGANVVVAGRGAANWSVIAVLT